MAAVLAGGLGTLASHRSAAWLWGLLDEPDRPEVTTTRSRAPRPRGTIAHRLLDMADANVSLRQGIPVTNPLRTLVDLGAVVPTSRLRNAVHVAVADRLVTYAGLEAELARLAKPGRRGVGPLRVVLGERFDRTRSPSVLESRMDRVIAAANVPRPEIERIVGPEGEYRTDYRWKEVLLILEAKGFAAHGSPEAASRDFERELSITEAGGYQILSVGWDQATRGARKLARQLNSIYHSRRQLLLGA
jgi:hypothetical protein